MSLKLLHPIRIQFFVNVRDLNHPKNVSFFILCCKSQCKLLVKLVKIQFLIKYNVSYDFYTDLIDSVKTVWIIEDGGDFQHLYSLFYFSIMFHMKWKSNEREIDRESLFTQTPNLLFQDDKSRQPNTLRRSHNIRSIIFWFTNLIQLQLWSRLLVVLR